MEKVLKIIDSGKEKAIASALDAFNKKVNLIARILVVTLRGGLRSSLGMRLVEWTLGMRLAEWSLGMRLAEWSLGMRLAECSLGMRLAE